jgi:hypothetical protein
VLVVSIPSSEGDGNIGSPTLRLLALLWGVLGVNKIFGKGVFGDAAVLIGEQYIVELKLGEPNIGILRSASSLLRLLLQDDAGSLAGNPIPSSSSLTSSS